MSSQEEVDRGNGNDLSKAALHALYYTYGGGHLSSHPWQRCHAFDAHVQLGDENTIIDCESLEIPRVS